VLPLAVSVFRINVPMAWVVGLVFLGAIYGVPVTPGMLAMRVVTSTLLSFSVATRASNRGDSSDARGRRQCGQVLVPTIIEPTEPRDGNVRGHPDAGALGADARKSAAGAIPCPQQLAESNPGLADAAAAATID
jgi:hypothetical protein